MIIEYTYPIYLHVREKEDFKMASDEISNTEWDIPEGEFCVFGTVLFADFLVTYALHFLTDHGPGLRIP